MKNTLAKWGIDGFLLAIIAMIVLAWFVPEPGLAREPFSLEEAANYGVAVIFFFYGLRLSPQAMREGLTNWKMHVLIQATTFLLFPLLALAVHPFFHSEEGLLLWQAIFFLAALPSTVSSSVVMVSIAKGNIPAAIFNAGISSLLGLVLTPLWTGLFITASSDVHTDTSQIAGKLVLQVLLPVVAGLLLHRYGGAFAEKHKKKLKLFDQTVILIIIYTSFCHSFFLHLFDSFTTTGLMLLGAGMLMLFLTVMGIVYGISQLLGFSAADRITVIFCGSKKSLVHGTVMANVLFSGSAATGILLLPLMFYHALQLIAASILAQAVAKRQIN